MTPNNAAFLLLALVPSDPTPVGGDSTLKLVLAVMAILPGALALARGIVDWRTTPRADTSGSVAARRNIVRLKTAPARYPTRRQIFRKRVLYYGFAAYFAVFTVAVGYVLVFQRSPLWAFIFAAITLLSALTAAYFGIWAQALAGKGRRVPIREETVSLLVEDEIEEIAATAQRALLVLGAFQTRGTRILVRRSNVALLQGGVRGWPWRANGERIRITIQRRNGMSHTVLISSSSFMPRWYPRHAQNVHRIMRVFLEDDARSGE